MLVVVAEPLICLSPGVRLSLDSKITLQSAESIYKSRMVRQDWTFDERVTDCQEESDGPLTTFTSVNKCMFGKKIESALKLLHV